MMSRAKHLTSPPAFLLLHRALVHHFHTIALLEVPEPLLKRHKSTETAVPATVAERTPPEFNGQSSRMKKLMSKAFTKLPCDAIRVTGFSRTSLHIAGATLLDVTNDTMFDTVNSMLNAEKLQYMTDFQRKNGFHYGIYAEGQLVTVMTILVGKINDTPGKIAVSVEWLVSIDTNHSACWLVDSLKSVVVNRRFASVVFTQCAKTSVAKAFWQGRMTQSTWANIYVGLFNSFDEEYLIYEDAVNMVFYV